MFGGNQSGAGGGGRRDSMPLLGRQMDNIHSQGDSMRSQPPHLSSHSHGYAPPKHGSSPTLNIAYVQENNDAPAAPLSNSSTPGGGVQSLPVPLRRVGNSHTGHHESYVGFGGAGDGDGDGDVEDAEWMKKHDTRRTSFSMAHQWWNGRTQTLVWRVLCLAAFICTAALLYHHVTEECNTVSTPPTSTTSFHFQQQLKDRLTELNQIIEEWSESSPSAADTTGELAAAGGPAVSSNALLSGVSGTVPLTKKLLPKPSEYSRIMSSDTASKQSRAKLSTCIHHLYPPLSKNEKWEVIDPPLYDQTPPFIQPKQKWWSSEWQDWFIYNNFFQGKIGGVYVDVGGNNPVWGSNSYFYDVCLGWKGVCVEPNPEYTDGYGIERTCQLSQKCASNAPGKLNFVNDGPTGRIGDSGSLTVECDTLDSILTNSNLATHNIDFVSLDVEGNEMNVLRVFPFHKWNITLWSIETDKLHVEELNAIMFDAGYSHVTDLGPDSIYVKRDQYIYPADPAIIRPKEVSMEWRMNKIKMINDEIKLKQQHKQDGAQ